MNLLYRERSLAASCRKELNAVLRREAAFRKQAEKEPAQWKTALAAKVPEKISTGLQSAFGKAFSVVLEQGAKIIDKTYDQSGRAESYQVQDHAVKRKKSRKELKRLRKMAQRSNFLNTAVTTAEGVAFGALGIGMPDIIVFIGFLLRGAYECASQYGFDPNDPQERYRILRMMEAALAKGDDWLRLNAGVDVLLTTDHTAAPEEREQQIRRTSDAFAVELLLLKFVQGLPLIGIVGGLGNPLYYKRILGYVQVKYYKRYLMRMLRE